MTKVAKKIKNTANRKGAVEIAKDVLKALTRTDYEIECGYCKGNVPAKDAINDKDMGEVLPIIRKHCQVCALGGMLLAKAKLYDEVPMSDFVDTDGDVFIVRDDCYEHLSDYFDNKQLNMIEDAFEGWANGFCGDLPPRQRVRKIMENIIANNGTFDPTQRAARPGRSR